MTVRGELSSLPGSWDEAASAIGLRAYGTGPVGVDRLELAVGGNSEAGPALLEPAHDIRVGAVVSVPEGHARVSEHLMQSWGVGFDHVANAAFQRLNDREVDIQRIGQGTFLINDPDFAGAVWLRPSMIEQLPTVGKPLAWAVTQQRLLVTGTDDPEGMTIAAATIQELQGRGERIESVTAHQTADLGWAPVQWPATPDFTSDRIQRLYRASLYQRQAPVLTEYFRQHHQEVFVPEYVPLAKADGQPWSMCNWTEGVRAALPVADEVVLVRSDGATLGLGWNALYRNAAGALLEPAGTQPERFITNGFPDDGLIDRALGTNPA